MGAFFHIKNRNMKGGPTMPETAARSQHETVGAIYRIPLSELHPHPLNPFAIRDDPSMLELNDSVKQFGVLAPARFLPYLLPESGWPKNLRRRWYHKNAAQRYRAGLLYPAQH